MIQLDSLQFACIDCGHRFAAQGDCTRCKSGPLMDLANPDVRQSLLAEDDLRRGQRQRQAIWAAVPLAVVVLLVLGVGLLGFVVSTAVGYGASLAIAAIFPAKQLFAYLEGAG